MGRKPKHQHEDHASDADNQDPDAVEADAIRDEMERSGHITTIAPPTDPDPAPITVIAPPAPPAELPEVTALHDIMGNKIDLIPELAAQVLPWVGGSSIASVSILENGSVKVVKAANGQKRIFSA